MRVHYCLCVNVMIYFKYKSGIEDIASNSLLIVANLEYGKSMKPQCP